MESSLGVRGIWVLCYLGERKAISHCHYLSSEGWRGGHAGRRLFHPRAIPRQNDTWTETQSLERRLGKAFEISLSMGNTFSLAPWVSEQLSLQKSLKTESFKAPSSAPPSACFSADFPQNSVPLGVAGLPLTLVLRGLCPPAEEVTWLAAAGRPDLGAPLRCLPGVPAYSFEPCICQINLQRT